MNVFAQTTPARSRSAIARMREPLSDQMWEASTPVKIVGANQKPCSGIAQSAVQRSAPSASPMSLSSRMRASCAAELIAPMSVFLSSGSPRRSVYSRFFNRSTTSSWIDSCTSRRLPAQHTCPWLKKMPLTMPSTA